MDIISFIAVLHDPFQFIAGMATMGALWGGRKVIHVRKTNTMKQIAPPQFALEASSEIEKNYVKFDKIASLLESKYDAIKTDFALTFPRLDIQNYLPEKNIKDVRGLGNKALESIQRVKNTNLTKAQIESEKLLNVIDIEASWLLNIIKTVDDFSNLLANNVEISTLLNKQSEERNKNFELVKEMKEQALNDFDPEFIVGLQPIYDSLEETINAFNVYKESFTFCKTTANFEIAKNKCRMIDNETIKAMEYVNELFNYSLAAKKKTKKFRKLIAEISPQGTAEHKAHQSALASIVKAENHIYTTRNPETEFSHIMIPFIDYVTMPSVERRIYPQGVGKIAS